MFYFICRFTYKKILRFFCLSVSPKNLEKVCAACEVLLKYILNTLHRERSDLTINTQQLERYINAIQLLCIGKGSLTSTEFSSLVEIMKGENLPQQSVTTGKTKFTYCSFSNRHQLISRKKQVAGS